MKLLAKRVGIYDVLYKCDYRAKDGHELCRVRCSVCGRESDMLLSQISRAKSCTHICLGGHLLPQYSWKSQRLKGIFAGIKNRCYNKNDKSYRWYGGKGIKVCEEWLLNPGLFEDWAYANDYNDNLTIDRIDENKWYCPENCRWVAMKDNARYKSTTKITYVDGVGHTGRDWADILNVGTNVINTMLRERGEDVTKEFIRRRLKDVLQPIQYSSWLKTYNIT